MIYDFLERHLVGDFLLHILVIIHAPCFFLTSRKRRIEFPFGFHSFKFKMADQKWHVFLINQTNLEKLKQNETTLNFYVKNWKNFQILRKIIKNSKFFNKMWQKYQILFQNGENLWFLLIDLQIQHQFKNIKHKKSTHIRNQTS